MVDISLPRLALALIPLLAVAGIAYRWSGRAGEFGWATLRMLVQLLSVGYVLVILFKVESGWMGLGVVTFMIIMSSWIAVRTVKKSKFTAWRDALLGIGLGGSAVLALVVLGVLNLDPWYQPRLVIPLAGMIFSNAMTAVTLSAERWAAELESGREPLAARRTAWNAALIPQMNAFLAVGLVSLPGMMTGQILAGASPLSAVRYQILVMAMVMGSAGIAVAVFLTRTLARQSSKLKPAA